jgi:hypothetical protein
VRARTASRSPGSGTRTRALIFGALLAALPLSLAGQDSPWNDARVLELVGRARTLRSAAVVDSSFQSYQATARGYVYFFFDRPDRPERTAACG